MVKLKFLWNAQFPGGRMSFFENVSESVVCLFVLDSFRRRFCGSGRANDNQRCFRVEIFKWKHVKIFSFDLSNGNNVCRELKRRILYVFAYVFSVLQRTKLSSEWCCST